MGCFDFTFADNGENTHGQKGYIYFSKKFTEQTGIKSPLRYIYLNEYGDFSFKHKDGNIYTLDIYAIYAAMLAIEQEIPMTTDLQKYINHCKSNIKFVTSEYPNGLSNAVRKHGIQYFFNNIKALTKPFPKGTLPKLGNQQPRNIEYQEIFTGRIPLLISKKKLPQEKTDDLTDIVKNWSCTSTSDPNQGFFITKNLYCKYMQK